MDRNEHFGGGSQTSYFSQAICDQTSGHTGYYDEVSSDGNYLSTDTPYLFSCLLSALDTTVLSILYYNSTFRKVFFQMAAILKENEILTRNQSQMKLKHQIFIGRKILFDMSNHF